MEETTKSLDSASEETKGLEIGGYRVEGVSIAGQETCIIFPTLNSAFDIGGYHRHAIPQDFLFISHGHMDHIGGLFMYVASRELLSMKPPTIVVPTSMKMDVEKLFQDYRKVAHSELKHNLVGLNVGEEFYLRKDLKVKAFKTYHVEPCLGYVLYSVKQKLKQEYVGLSRNEIKNLKLSGVEITYITAAPEVAFTGDTMSDFIVDETNYDVLKAKVLVMESTYVDKAITKDHAREHGHTHLSEIVSLGDKFQNKAILLIHFSARYKAREIQAAVSSLCPPLAGRIYALTEGFK